MADELNVSTQKELEEWLKDEPAEWAQEVAARIALRVLPLVGQISNSTKLGSDDEEQLIFLTYRTGFISLTGRKYPTEDMISAALTADAALAAALTVARSANAARTALAAANATRSALAARTPLAVLAADDAAFAADAVHTARAAARAAYVAFDIWNAISQDTSWLIAHEDDGAEQARSLLETELWPDGEPEWARVERRNMEQLLIENSDHHIVWINWYNNVLNGKSFFGLPSTREKALTLKIAQQHNEFWEQDFAKVSENISDWLEDARIEDAAEAAQRQLDEEEVDLDNISEPEQQKAHAVQFIGEDDEPIGVDYLADTNSLLNDEAANDRHLEVSRLADAMINSYDPTEKGANSASDLIVEVTHYRQSLGSSPLEAKPDLLVPRGDALRMVLEAHKSKDENLSDLPPVSDKYILALEKVVKAHNPYVNFDPTLAARDEALLGPDAKTNLVSPDDGRKFIEGAVAQNVAKPEVEEVLAEEAKVAPAVPDPVNRKSRRYSEGVKNFARKALSVLWNNKGKIGVGVVALPPSAIAVANWVVGSETQLLKIFADNPAMLETTTKLIELLRTLPLG